METLRREPFRLLFPLGILLAWCAVVPWVLFGTGMIRSWLGAYHALTMTEGFVVAIAVGFLGTMIPRRTGAAPMSTFELLLCAACLAAVPVTAIAQSWIGTQAAYLVVLVTMAQFALRRMRHAPRAAPPSFVFLPLGALAGAVGALMLACAQWTVNSALFPAGRSLVEEGLLIALVLALAPMLTPIICHGAPPADLPPERAQRQRRLHLAAGLLFLASFAVQHVWSERAGLLLRGLVVAAELIAAGVLVSPTVPGLHRHLYRLALAFVPLGPLAAAAQPAYRVPLLHLTFVGGLSLLVFAVSFHVVFMHTGREALARAWPKPVIAVAVLTLAATLTRALAERMPTRYFGAIAMASSLWLTGALIWGLFLSSLIVRRAKASEG